MVLAAMIEEGYDTIWLFLLFASAGVLHHAGIKIPYHAFFAKDAGIRTEEAPINMLAAMGIAAILCILIGTLPSYLYAILPWEVEFWPYDTTHVLTQLQLLLFAVLAFVWMEKMGLHPHEIHGVNLDIEWLYRKLLPETATDIYKVSHYVSRYINNQARSSIKDIADGLRSTRIARLHLATSWPTGSMVFWIAVILGLFLLADVML